MNKYGAQYMRDEEAYYMTISSDRFYPHNEYNTGKKINTNIIYFINEGCPIELVAVINNVLSVRKL